MSSGVSSPVSVRPSAMPGSTQSARPARRFRCAAIASRLGHSFGRRLGSKDTVRPAARIAVIACSTSSAQLADRAGVMPVTCRCRAARKRDSSKSARDSALAAEPRRKYSTTGSCPSSARDLSMKPVGRVVSVATAVQSMPSASSARRM